MDDIDARLLDVIQVEFPLVSRPFEILGERLSIQPSEAVARTARLKSDGIIREISAIFDSAALGYTSALIAAEVDARQLDEAGKVVAKHPGVSHCYARDNAVNLWFTLTLGPGRELAAEAGALLALPGVVRWMILPASRVFKIGVFFGMTGDHTDNRPPVRRRGTRHDGCLTADDRAVVSVLQQDIPIVEAPFAHLAAEAGISEEELLTRSASLRDRGVMRRYAAVLRHARAGYVVNAMVCWRVDPARIAEVGEKFAGHKAVSHCYERPIFADWPYSVYTMLHCRGDDELRAVLDKLADISGFCGPCCSAQR